MVERTDTRRYTLLFNGAALKEAREEEHWTRKHLAKAVGIAPVTLWRYETGKSQIPKIAALALMYVLHRDALESMAVQIKNILTNVEQAAL